MTIPENAGLSHLADVANVNDGIIRYPVKKKGEPRRLNPNWPAIHWLEDESETNTEISEEYEAGESVLDEEGNLLGVEFKVQRALGYYSARHANMYPWPMFQTFGSFRARSQGYLDPCPDCDDWSRTSQCEEHHDQDGVAGLKLGDQRRQDRRRARDAAAGRQVVNAYYPPELADAIVRLNNEEARYILGGFQTPGSLIRSMEERWAEALASAHRATPSNTTVEVSSETIQGIQSVRIHVEADGEL